MAGIVTTLFLFWFMNFMINRDDNKLDESTVYKLIEFVELKKEMVQPEIKKELPPEPKQEKEPPKLTNEVVENQNVNDMQEQTPLKLNMPNLDGGMKVGGAPKMLSPMQALRVDAALTPMVQIKPVYPSREKRMGVEGYVKVELDVDALGHVLSVTILESEPAGAFDKSVLRALKKWKFRPKTVDGVAVGQKGVLTLNFKLGQE